MEDNDNTNWIFTREAIDISGYASEHLRWLLRTKAVRAKRFGPVWQVDKDSLLEYMRKQGRDSPTTRG